MTVIYNFLPLDCISIDYSLDYLHRSLDEKILSILQRQDVSINYPHVV